MSLLAESEDAQTEPPPRVGPLTEYDRPDLVALVAADPVVNAVLDSRLRFARSLSPSAVGGRLLGSWGHDGRLRGALLDSGSVHPVGGGVRDWTALAGYLAHERRAASSIVGTRAALRAMWPVLTTSWGPARIVRDTQPLLVLDRSTQLPLGDSRVRVMRTTDLDRYLPAARAMFREELETDPLAAPGSYRARLAAGVAAGRAFGLVDGCGEVVFKADIGCVTPTTCQLTGVWTRPDLRGRGVATGALASVLRHALTLAPTVSLYVNDFNVPARRLYARLGMAETAVLSTILF